jgi:hypothetical protein
MSVLVNILDTYYMAGLWEGLSPVPTFFRDRYFPTGAGDIYAADKVLVEYKDGDNDMAPFMVMGADPINVKREGYEIHDYSPTYVSQSRDLTADQLKQRGFGEAILSKSTEEERAAKLVSEDLALLERRFSRTEEYLCSQVMINNGFTIQEHLDETHTRTAELKYYDPLKGNDGVYTITQWGVGTTFADVCADIEAMCDALSERGLPAVDLVIGRKVRDFLLSMSDFRDLVNKQSGIIVAEGGIRQTLSQYQGVTFLGTINFNGYDLNVIVSNEQYSAVSGGSVVRTNYFPATSMMVTAPAAGHLMYAHIVHMDEAGEIDTITGKRVPDLFVDRKKKKREIILESRPLAAPQNYSPWIYAAGVVA